MVIMASDVENIVTALEKDMYEFIVETEPSRLANTVSNQLRESLGNSVIYSYKNVIISKDFNIEVSDLPSNIRRVTIRVNHLPHMYYLRYDGEAVIRRITEELLRRHANHELEEAVETVKQAHEETDVEEATEALLEAAELIDDPNTDDETLLETLSPAAPLFVLPHEKLGLLHALGADEKEIRSLTERVLSNGKEVDDVLITSVVEAITSIGGMTVRATEQPSGVAVLDVTP